MILFPYKKFDINVDLPVDEIINVLHKSVEAEVLLRTPKFMNAPDCPFEGELTSSGFSIRRLTMFNNSSSVIMTGKLIATGTQSTTIKMRVGYTDIFLFGLIIWFCFLAFLILTVAIKHNTAPIIPILMGIVTYTIFLVIFIVESKRSEDILRQLINENILARK